MSLSKAEGVVLRGIKFGEASKIVALYTKELGKINLMVKGARSPRRGLASTLQFLSHIGVVYYFKEGRGLQFLSQAHLINPFWEIKGDLDRFCVASAGTEFISRLQIGQQSHPDLFLLLINFLDRGGNIAPQYLKPLLLSFLLQASQLLGYGPSFSRCIHCERDILSQGEGDLLFSPEGGGVICNECVKRNGYYLKPSADLIRALKLLSSGLERVEEVGINDFDFGSAYRLLNPFWEYYAPGYRSLRTLEVWQEIGEQGAG